MEVWAKRIGVALVAAVLGVFVLWIVGALVIISIRWLSVYIPSETMLIMASVIFVIIVVGDWALDAYNKRDKRDML